MAGLTFQQRLKLKQRRRRRRRRSQKCSQRYSQFPFGIPSSLQRHLLLFCHSTKAFDAVRSESLPPQKKTRQAVFIHHLCHLHQRPRILKSQKGSPRIATLCTTQTLGPVRCPPSFHTHTHTSISHIWALHLNSRNGCYWVV